MKLTTTIKIDLLDFVKTGKFDYIKPGQTKEWILNNFPDPDYFSEDFLKPGCSIWTYGNIEFHFDKKNELFLIFSDYLQELDGGESLELNKWIFEEYSKLNLAYVLTQLNKEAIDYCKASDQFGLRLATKAGVELTFSEDLEDKCIDVNRLHITSLGLMKRK